MKKIVLILCFIILIFSGYVYANEKPEENKDNGLAMIEKTEEGYLYKGKVLNSISDFRLALGSNKKALDLYNEYVEYKNLGNTFLSFTIISAGSAAVFFLTGVVLLLFQQFSVSLILMPLSLALLVFAIPFIPLFICNYRNCYKQKKEAINVFNNDVSERDKISGSRNHHFDFDLFCIRL